MHEPRLLIGSAQSDQLLNGSVVSVRATGEQSPHFQSPSRFGFLTSLGAASLGVLASIGYGEFVAGRPVLTAGSAAVLVLGLSWVHAWFFFRRPRDDRAAREAFLWWHRVVVAMLGATCAGLAWWWIEGRAAYALSISCAFLVLVASLGASAVQFDRATFGVWISTMIAVPVIALLGSTAPGATPGAIVLAAAGAVIVGMSMHMRRMASDTITMRRENDLLVDELRSQVALVEAANAEKSRFLGAASHDLRQPMHALGLFAAAIEKELRGTAQHAKVISMVHAVDALEDSFGAMLDVSRLDAGIVQPTLQAFPVRDVLRRLHMHCAGQAEERGLSLRLRAGGKLVTSDPQLLERILSNLVHNAIRYTNQGGVVVVTRSRKARTSIEVWDTGVGIAPEELPKIFNEFYQVENPGRDRTRGLGMGLSIVKRLVLLLGHELEVRSTPGRGTVFRLLLRPTELSELGAVVLAADTIPSALDEERTVLVIDDEAAVRAGMNDLLSSWGFTILLASGIAEATAAVRRHAGVIDVLISDLRLGGDEDGIAAIAAVRETYGAPLPAILVTGDTSAHEVKRVHESGHPVLFKPVRARDLFSALRSVP